MRFIYRTLIVIVALTVLGVWTFRMKAGSIFRGGDATNMLEEFQAYGLTETQMYIVGFFKITAAILLLLGFRFKRLVVIGASTMAVFMSGAIFMHLSIGDGIIPTLP
ncbi:MAG: DoxX family protein, partial [Bacteroidota bacterium]